MQPLSVVSALTMHSHHTTAAAWSQFPAISTVPRITNTNKYYVRARG